MASVKELNAKIASLKNTQKMTKTMKLVSASKMRRAQQAQENARDYAVKMRRLLAGVAAAEGGADLHPLLVERREVKHVHVLLIVSDRGLCGGFNNTLFRYVTRWIAEQGSRFESLNMSCAGRRGYAYFRKRLTVTDYYEGVTESPRYEAAIRITDGLMEDFKSGKVDEVYVAVNEFKSALVQTPTLRRLLPIEPDTSTETAPADYLFEPDKHELLNLLLPNAVRFQVYNALLENAAGEQAARMTAMDSATKNATDMIDHNTLLRNRERQAVITRELIEIVTGAESL